MVDFDKLKQKPKALDANGPAQVRVALEERLSGPQGTYSSVSVRIEVEARCVQGAEQIREASRLLYAEAARALEHFIEPARERLIVHIERFRG